MLFPQVLRIFRSGFSRSLQIASGRRFISLERKFLRNMESRVTKEFVIEQLTPFEQLEVTEAFENLTEREQKYLHFYTKVDRDFAEYSYDLTDFFFAGFVVWLANFIRAIVSRSSADLFTVQQNIFYRKGRFSSCC
jgi:hypothetical protein